MTTVGFLHPGSMGVTLAANIDAERLWVGVGRSAATTDRAASADLIDAGSLDELCARSDVIVSICPPAAAQELARSVAATGFRGHYLDANAIAPATSIAIGALFGDQYIDGGVIGPPAIRAGTTRLYLAGPGAADLATRWQGSALDARVVADQWTGGAASALKMAYAGWTKGSSALLLAMNALATDAGVADALHAEWELSQPGLLERSARTAAGTGPKAWRWVGEMEEIATTLGGAGLPEGFHRAAGELYLRMAGFKDSDGPSLDAVLDAILAGQPSPGPGSDPGIDPVATRGPTPSPPAV